MVEALHMLVLLLVVFVSGVVGFNVYDRVAPTMKKKHRIWLFAMLLGLVVALSAAVATQDPTLLIDYVTPMSRSPGLDWSMNTPPEFTP